MNTNQRQEKRTYDLALLLASRELKNNSSEFTDKYTGEICCTTLGESVAWEMMEMNPSLYDESLLNDNSPIWEASVDVVTKWEKNEYVRQFV